MNKMKTLMLAGGLCITALTSSISYAGPQDNSVNQATVVENPVETFQSSSGKESSKQSSDKN